MRISRKELIECFLLVAIPAVAWFGSEVRWARINNPQGKFSLRFQRDWPLRRQEMASIDDLKRTGFQPDGAANGS
jgi:hypothetical protein